MWPQEWQAWMVGLPPDILATFRNLREQFEEAPLSENEKSFYERKAINEGHSLDTPDIHKLVSRFPKESPVIEMIIFFDANRIGILDQWEKRIIAH